MIVISSTVSETMSITLMRILCAGITPAATGIKEAILIECLIHQQHP